MKYVWIIAILLLIGCGPPQEFPVEVQVDSRFLPDELPIIERSFEQWLEATGGLAQYRLHYGFEARCNYRESEDNRDQKVIYRCFSSSQLVTQVSREDGFNPRVAGFADTDRIVLVVDQIRPDPVWDSFMQFVTMHEIGHLYGLPHLKFPPNNLMTHGDIKTCVDSAVLSYFCNLYDCNDYPVNWHQCR